MARSAPALSSKRSNLHGLLQLARPLNLLIAAGTLLALRYGWMARWEPKGAFTQLSGVDFLLGMMVVVLLMAAGNLINAYFDVTEDRINQPELAIVDRTIKRRVLIIAHVGLNLVGLGIAAWLSVRHADWKPFSVAVAVSFVLWKYSASWKGVPVLGNLTVAIMLGLVPLWLAILESPFHAGDRGQLFWPMLGIGGMAFGVGLVREIVKDARDVTGDLQAGKRSIPISFGLTVARNVALILMVVLMAIYGAATWWISLNEGLLAWISWLAPLPFMMLSTLSLTGKSAHWPRADRWLLLTLVIGFLQCLWIGGF